MSESQIPLDFSLDEYAALHEFQYDTFQGKESIVVGRASNGTTVTLILSANVRDTRIEESDGAQFCVYVIEVHSFVSTHTVRICRSNFMWRLSCIGVWHSRS